VKEWLQQVDRWRRTLALDLLAEQWESDRDLNSHLQAIVLGEIANQLCQQYKLPWIDWLPTRSFDATAPCFANVPIEFLGQSYERLLKTPLRICQKHGTSTVTIGRVKAQQGNYYTPESIVQRMLHTTLGELLHETTSLPSLRILDPACGGGIFLTSAYRYLLDWYSHRLIQAHQQGSAMAGWLAPHPSKPGSLTGFARSQILLNHIFGVDLDPQAIAITRLSLLLIWAEGLDQVTTPLPDLTANLWCGNALIESDPTAMVSSQETIAFPYVSEGFDLVIGNPPYMDAEQMTITVPQWRSYCQQRYQTASGNWDVFCVFIEKALQWCKSGGLTSLIVPNKLASAPYAAAARSLLTQTNQLLSLHNYSAVSIFAASVYPLVYIVRKTPPNPSTGVCYQQMQDVHTVAVQYTIPYERLHHSQHPWVFVPETTWALVNRLQRTFPPLSTVATVWEAATVGEAYALQPQIRECCQPQRGDFKLVNSGAIDRYMHHWGDKPIRYLGNFYHHPIVSSNAIMALSPKRHWQATQPKLLVAGMSQRLEVVIDPIGTILAGKSTVIIFSPIDLRYLLGILNSHVATLFFTTMFQGNQLQGGYLRVGAPQIRQIPVPLPNLDDESDRQAVYQLIQLVDQLINLYQQRKRSQSTEAGSIQQAIEQGEQQIDRLVYRLYQVTAAELGS
jgi:hypothetical protein